ncbi:MAG: efflux RND transporter permease subunit, partial [Tepidisphaeraceae bacterium]
MKVASFASRHARSSLFLLAALLAGGLAGALALPVSLFPHISFPRIRVNLEAGERPAERMMVEVTRPVEEALRSIPGVRGVRSTTSRGSAEVSLTFDWGLDMTAAFLQAQAEVNRLLPKLPAGATFEVRRMDPTVFPVIAYSLTSDARPLSELHDLAQYQLLPVLSTVQGVAKIGVDGGAKQEYRVTLDPARLQAHGLAVGDITAALSAGNVLSAVGRMVDFHKQYLIVTDAHFNAIADIGQTVLRGGAGGVIRLADVAEISPAVAPQFIKSTADGRDCVLLNVYQQPGGNTVRIAGDIRPMLQQEAKHLPPDVKLHCWYDQSDLITASASSVRDAVIIGVVLAALVLLLFLRNLRMTLIAGLAVPVVLGVTCLLLYVLGQSLNMMTLGGMAAAVGLIIDDAIVMSEHIVRRLHGRHEDGVPQGNEPADAHTKILRATDEFTKPLAGSSLSTIVIHIPPAFLVGVFGAFFAALSLSMAISLIISFLVAWIAIPILAAHWLRQQDVKPEENGRFTRATHRGYERVMRMILPRPWVILLVVVPLLAWGYFNFTKVQSGLMPAMDEGGFVIDYIGPPGASIPEMDRLLRRVESILSRTPEVDTYSRRTGFSLGGDISESNIGDFFIRLKPFPRRDIDEVLKEVRDKINHDVPGLDIDAKQLMEDLIGDLTGQPQPIVVNLFAEDEATLRELAPKVADAIKGISYVNSVETGVVPAGDALDVQIDRAQAALEGVDPDAVTRQLSD